jgi:hypothetical protein
LAKIYKKKSAMKYSSFFLGFGFWRLKNLHPVPPRKEKRKRKRRLT